MDAEFFIDSIVQWLVTSFQQHHLHLLAWMVVICGLAVLSITAVKLVRFIVTQFFRRPLDLATRYGRGSWVVVSGSSGGIGLGFAVEFAKLGFNIVLISRSLERLQNAEKQVHEVSPSVRTRVIVADFSQSHSADFWDRLMTQLADLDVSVLVNNVGVNHTEPFVTISPDVLRDMVEVNCTSQLLFTRCLVRRLLERAGWRDEQTQNTNQAGQVRSAVISVSSVAGQRPLLFLSPYSATKAFNDFFSRALALEYPDYLDVLSLRPGYVVSKMSKIKTAGGFVLDPYECARGCLEKLGYVTETYGDPRHAIYARSFFLLPEIVLASRRRQRLMEKNASILEEQKGNFH